MEKKQNKPRWKLNVFDVIIIAAVIIAAGVVLYLWRFSGNSSNAAATIPVRYTIELTGLLDGTSEKIQEGDTILDSTKKFVMGEVVSFKREPTVMPQKNYYTGNTVSAEIPGRETVLIEIVCNCSVSAAQITAESGYVIRIGAEATAGGPGYAGKGYIVAIERGDLGE
jgi:hypothetical protein